MKYSLLALLTLCVTGCAAKKPANSNPPGIHYLNCHEVSVNYKTQEVTVICPLKETKK